MKLWTPLFVPTKRNGRNEPGFSPFDFMVRHYSERASPFCLRFVRLVKRPRVFSSIDGSMYFLVSHVLPDKR